MCKLTILHYTRCNCNAQDGNGGDGFILTKGWHDRLFLDRDAVPYERCLRAKSSALRTSMSSTMEFSPCRDARVKNIRFEEEVCFRCLMHRRSKQRADEIRALFVEWESFSGRYATTRESADRDATLNKGIWQSIRASPRFDKTWKDERQRFVGTIGDLRATQFESAKADWELRLERQIVSRAKTAEKQIGLEAEKPCAEEKEQEGKKKQAILACLQLRLAQANTRAVSPVTEEKEDESPLAEDKEKEQTAVSEEIPEQRLRIAPTASTSSCGLGPRLDAMVSARMLQSLHEEESPEPLPNPSGRSTPEIIVAHPSVRPGTNELVVGSRTARPIAAIKIVAPEDLASNGDKARPVVKPASSQALSPDVLEFTPFKQAPPTEPKMMRVPTAPRAMREAAYSTYGSMPRMRGYSTVRNWRQ